MCSSVAFANVMFSDFFFCRSFRNCRFEVFDPSSYLVVIPEADAQKTDEILRGIPQEKIQQLCENGRRIYDSHYSSYDGMLNATLQARIYVAPKIFLVVILQQSCVINIC